MDAPDQTTPRTVNTSCLGKHPSSKKAQFDAPDEKRTKICFAINRIKPHPFGRDKSIDNPLTKRKTTTVDKKASRARTTKKNVEHFPKS
ncbi:hypothetical protein, partial [Parendozoicomonas sp. Alg238-R29]|uniref:hypothetical protein n=1 Tax=Parendozoicomonas sp. Alg238-R29 TaxID=2993446 RepID=UPI00248E5957